MLGFQFFFQKLHSVLKQSEISSSRLLKKLFFFILQSVYDHQKKTTEKLNENGKISREQNYHHNDFTYLILNSQVLFLDTLLPSKNVHVRISVLVRGRDFRPGKLCDEPADRSRGQAFQVRMTGTCRFPMFARRAIFNLHTETGTVRA